MYPLRSGYLIKTFEKEHDRSKFSCGNDTLDKYLREQMTQDIKKRAATAFVLTEPAGNTIIGYCTLAAGNIDLGELPDEQKKKLPLYPAVPVTLLGRLALDKSHHGRNLGEYLLMDALRRCAEAAKEVASAAVIVEAIEDKARKFYEHYGFIVFPNQSNKLFLPMQTIEKIF